MSLKNVFAKLSRRILADKQMLQFIEKYHSLEYKNRNLAVSVHTRNADTYLMYYDKKNEENKEVFFGVVPGIGFPKMTQISDIIVIKLTGRNISVAHGVGQNSSDIFDTLDFKPTNFEGAIQSVDDFRKKSFQKIRARSSGLKVRV